VTEENSVKKVKREEKENMSLKRLNSASSVDSLDEEIGRNLNHYFKSEIIPFYN